MRPLITSIVLCVFAQVAAAQCVNPATATPVSAQVRPGPELITSAVAAPGETAPLRRASVTTAAKSSDAAGEEHHRPTGTAMLLAAVALMTGIALRRASADYR